MTMFNIKKRHYTLLFAILSSMTSSLYHEVKGEENEKISSQKKSDKVLLYVTGSVAATIVATIVGFSIFQKVKPSSNEEPSNEDLEQNKKPLIEDMIASDSDNINQEETNGATMRTDIRDKKYLVSSTHTFEYFCIMIMIAWKEYQKTFHKGNPIPVKLSDALKDPKIANDVLKLLNSEDTSELIRKSGLEGNDLIIKAAGSCPEVLKLYKESLEKKRKEGKISQKDVESLKFPEYLFKNAKRAAIVAGVFRAIFPKPFIDCSDPTKVGNENMLNFKGQGTVKALGCSIETAGNDPTKGGKYHTLKEQVKEIKYNSDKQFIIELETKNDFRLVIAKGYGKELGEVVKETHNKPNPEPFKDDIELLVPKIKNTQLDKYENVFQGATEGGLKFAAFTKISFILNEAGAEMAAASAVVQYRGGQPVIKKCICDNDFMVVLFNKNADQKTVEPAYHLFVSGIDGCLTGTS